MKKVAVVLCGSGFKDGSEIRESVGVLWALSSQNADVKIFALDDPQLDVVNCLSGQVVPGEIRNQRVEAARIARGQVASLKDCKAAAFDALVIPGGFGVAKNLCTFALKGSHGTVHPEAKRVLEEFHHAKKPIGAVCIAPALVALTFPKAGIELTLGGASEAAQELEKLGHRYVVKRADEWHWDAKFRIASTPAYMYDDASLKDIFTGIQGMVSAIL